MLILTCVPIQTTFILFQDIHVCRYKKVLLHHLHTVGVFCQNFRVFIAKKFKITNLSQGSIIVLIYTFTVYNVVVKMDVVIRGVSTCVYRVIEKIVKFSVWENCVAKSHSQAIESSYLFFFII